MGDVRVNEETKLLHPPVNNLPIESYLPLSVASIFPGVAQRIPSCGYDPKFVPPNGTNDSLSWPEPDLNKAKSVYRALENLASLSSRPRLQSRAFVRRQDIQRNLYSKAAEAADTKEMIVNRGRWMRTLIARGFLLYGESPWRVIGTGTLLILIATMLYPLGMVQIDETGEVLTYPRPPTPAGVLEVLLDSGYISLVAFVGEISGYTPIGFGRILVTVEMIAGVVLFALLIFVIGRRAAR